MPTAVDAPGILASDVGAYVGSVRLLMKLLLLKRITKEEDVAGGSDTETSLASEHKALDLSKYGEFVKHAGPESVDLSTYGDFVQDASEGMDLDPKYGPFMSRGRNFVSTVKVARLGSVDDLSGRRI